MSAGDEQVVRRWLQAVGRDPRALRWATSDLRIVQPDGREARGRLRCSLTAMRVGLRSRGTLRMEPLAVETHGLGHVRARTRNTAHAHGRRLDIEMTVDFTIRDGRIAQMVESVDDHHIAAWRAFWRP